MAAVHHLVWDCRIELGVCGDEVTTEMTRSILTGIVNGLIIGFVLRWVL
jgi:hypothetical protein